MLSMLGNYSAVTHEALQMLSGSHLQAARVRSGWSQENAIMISLVIAARVETLP